MTETLLALIPDYGLAVIFAGVLLATFGLPIPASMLALAAGGFAGTGDLDLWSVALTAFAAFVLGDQLAFGAAKALGSTLGSRLTEGGRFSRGVSSARALLDARGAAAVFLSHTLISPSCAFVTYLSGIGGLGHRAFTLAALPGAAIWTGFYTGLGYVFAARLGEMSSIIGNLVGTVAAALVLILSAVWIVRRWRAAQGKPKVA